MLQCRPYIHQWMSRRLVGCFITRTGHCCRGVGVFAGPASFTTSAGILARALIAKHGGAQIYCPYALNLPQKAAPSIPLGARHGDITGSTPGRNDILPSQVLSSPGDNDLEVSKLRHLLADDECEPHLPDVLSATLSIVERDMLHFLTPDEITRIAGVLGMVSLRSLSPQLIDAPIPLPIPTRSLGQTHHSHIKEPCWDVIHSLLATKQHLGHALSPDDELWYALPKVLACTEAMLEKYPSNDAASKVSVALHTLRNIRDDGVASVLLLLLATMGHTTSISIVINEFCHRLRILPELSKPFRAAIMTLIVLQNEHWSNAQQQLVLSKLFSHRLETTNTRWGNKGARTGSELQPSVEDLHWVLRNVLFAPSKVNAHSQVQRWCMDEITLSFQDDLEPAETWRRFRLLCLPYVIRDSAQSVDISNREIEALLRLNDKPTFMEILSVLLAWEQLRKKDANLSIDLDSVRHLWTVAQTAISYSVPPDSGDGKVQRAMISSFAKLAEHTMDEELFRRVIDFSAHNNVFVRQSKDDHGSRNLPRRLYLDACVTMSVVSVKFGARCWEDVFATLRRAGFDMDTLFEALTMKEVMSRVVIRVARGDATIAHTLYVDTQRTNWRVNSYAIGSVLQSCLDLGDIHRAITCAGDLSLPVTITGNLLGSVMDFIERKRGLRLHPVAAEVLGDAIIRAVPMHIRHDKVSAWEATVLLLQRHATPKHHLQIVLQVLGTQPHLWSDSFLAMLLRGLVKQQHFLSACKLATRLPPSRRSTPSLVRSVCEYLSFSRQPRLALALWKGLTASERARATPVQRLLAAVKFQYRNPKTPYVLQIPKMVLLSRHITQRQLNVALQLLIRADMHSATQRLYMRVRSSGKLIQPMQPSAMNILLGATLRPDPYRRNHRQLRPLLHYFQVLTSDGDVAADPVTLNILLKGVMRWPSVTTGQLRILFNRCVQAGYPAGERNVSGTYAIPFPTHTDGPSVAKDKQASEPLAFERHIKPLYKMFIKAFWVRGDRPAARTVVGFLQKARNASAAEEYRD